MDSQKAKRIIQSVSNDLITTNQSKIDEVFNAVLEGHPDISSKFTDEEKQFFLHVHNASVVIAVKLAVGATLEVIDEIREHDNL